MMIEHFIQKHPDMKIIEQRTILNYEYHTDGFYMCKMKKGQKMEHLYNYSLEELTEYFKSINASLIPLKYKKNKYQVMELSNTYLK